MKKVPLSLALGLSLMMGIADRAGAADAASAPSKPIDFQEVYSLIRSNLAGISDSELEWAATLGLTRQLEPRVTLVTDTQDNGSKATNAVKKSTLFDDVYGYIQVGQMQSDTAPEINKTYEKLRTDAKGKLKGLVIDLRFAGGQNYSSACDVADLFLNSEQPLIAWDGSSKNSTRKNNAISAPVVLLVNGETEGAAEALAAAMRQTEVGLVIGKRTAGRALNYKEFSLSHGQKLRIASGRVRVAGKEMPVEGLSPDIAVQVKVADERIYLNDPFRVISMDDGSTNSVVSVRPPRRKFNESDLVRMQQESSDRITNSEPTAADKPMNPVVTDPALARALDFLKGLSLVENRR